MNLLREIAGHPMIGKQAQPPLMAAQQNQKSSDLPECQRRQICLNHRCDPCLKQGSPLNLQSGASIALLTMIFASAPLSVRRLFFSHAARFAYPQLTLTGDIHLETKLI